MRSVGATTLRWADWRTRGRNAVLIRCRGKCEGCGQLAKSLELHHVAGRSHLVGEPWASTPELTAALCAGQQGCHHAVTYGTKPELTENLRWKAYYRLAIRFEPTFVYEPDSSPLDAIRQVIDHLTEYGWQWDGRNIVRAS